LIKGTRQTNRPRLQIMAFIIEVDYIECAGERLSCLEFKKVDFGPFSSALDKELLALVRDFGSGKPVAAIQSPLDIGRLEFVELSVKTLWPRKTKTLARMAARLDVLLNAPKDRIIDLDGFASRIQNVFQLMDKSPKLAKILKSSERSRKEGRWKCINLH
jgi:hypothetical protein